MDSNKIYRILDANFNRAKEGLRVVEEYVRFCIRDDKTMDEIRFIRHSLSSLSVGIYAKLLSQRDVENDVGATFKEKNRENIDALLVANFKRIEEALRVLEEYSKLLESVDADFAELSPKFKNFRFKIYEIEKVLTLKKG